MCISSWAFHGGGGGEGGKPNKMRLNDRSRFGAGKHHRRGENVSNPNEYIKVLEFLTGNSYRGYNDIPSAKQTKYPNVHCWWLCTWIRNIAIRNGVEMQPQQRIKHDAQSVSQQENVFLALLNSCYNLLAVSQQAVNMHYLGVPNTNVT